MDRRCRESEGKAKIEGYMSVSDEEAHQRSMVQDLSLPLVGLWSPGKHYQLVFFVIVS